MDETIELTPAEEGRRDAIHLGTSKNRYKRGTPEHRQYSDAWFDAVVDVVAEAADNAKNTAKG